MRVLIAIDGSANSFAAVEFAASLLSADKDPIALFYSAPGVQLTRESATSPEILSRAKKALADSVFFEAKQLLPAPFRDKAATITGEKPPKQGILLAAEEWKAEAIVVGARGVSPIKRLLLGSVSNHVALHAKIPVLIVRTQDGAAAKPKHLAVLLACDQTPVTEQVIKVVNQFSWPASTVGKSVCVIESLLAGEVPKWLEERARSADADAMARAWVAEHESEKKDTLAQMKTLCRTLPAAFQSEPMILEGHAADEILSTIQEQKSDLIVLGAHQKGAIEKFFVGSTTEKVMSHAPCSVLIVREHVAP